MTLTLSSAFTLAAVPSGFKPTLSLRSSAALTQPCSFYMPSAVLAHITTVRKGRVIR